MAGGLRTCIAPEPAARSHRPARKEVASSNEPVARRKTATGTKIVAHSEERLVRPEGNVAI
jgi:hypothetical protein